MLRRFPALAVPLLTLFLGMASGAGNGRVAWQTYDTEHFKIVFHQDVKRQADIAEDFLEQAYAKIRADLGVMERGIRITVVLTGLPDQSNGLSTPLGHRIIIYTRPMQTIASSDIAWLKRVLAHELAHQLTFLAMRKSFLGIYSELYKTFHLPAWFIEGVAQYEAESWDAKRNTFFAHVLYNSALEAYPNLTAFTKSDPVSGRLVYEQGHAFVRFLVHRHGKGFLGPLLKRFRVIPFWSEIMVLLSPMTGSQLPLEAALYAKTGRNFRVLYREFLDSVWAGMPRRVQIAPAVAGGLYGFDAVYQIKAAGPETFVFTGQKSWDQPVIHLFLSEKGVIRKLDPDFVNPVFDLSPDGHRVLFVRDYLNPYSDPVQKLFLRDLRNGTVRFLSDGAAHPVFLGNDSMAFSHYRNGIQKLSLCALALPRPVCRDAASDSLTGFFALSRSTRGVLGNATDTGGKTGVFEYVPGSGFSAPIPDSGLAEFPVQAENGSILVLRERQRLMQVEAWDPIARRFRSATTHPMGTFFLHRMAPGKIVSVTQTGKPGQWHLMPADVRPPAMDTARPRDTLAHADSVELDSTRSFTPDSFAAVDSSSIRKPDIVASYAGYRPPQFLSANIPNFDEAPIANFKPSAKRYHSPLEMRPLIAWPTLYDDFPGGSLGAGMLLEDPLQLHTLSVSLAGLHSGMGYNAAYVNRQLPVEFTLSAVNQNLFYTELSPIAGWDSLYLIRRTSEYFLQARIPLPWDLPLPHSVYLGVTARGVIRDYSLASSDNGQDLGRLDSWSIRKKEFRPELFLGYSHLIPHAYAIVHPLLYTDLELGYEKTQPGDGNLLFWYARQTVPLRGELTFTLWYYGQTNHPEFEVSTLVLPDGNTTTLFHGWDRGYSHNGYASLDFPLRKGFRFELPLLGPLNYLGCSIFGGVGREEYDAIPGYLASEQWDRKTAGAKVVFLFHPFRRIPLALSQSAQYDFEAGEWLTLTRGEFLGLPSSFDLFPNARKWRNGRHRLP